MIQIFDSHFKKLSAALLRGINNNLMGSYAPVKIYTNAYQRFW